MAERRRYTCTVELVVEATSPTLAAMEARMILDTTVSDYAIAVRPTDPSPTKVWTVSSVKTATKEEQ